MRILLIAGGPSPEASVSRVSAREVAAGLCQSGHEPAIVELDAELPRALSQCDVVFPLAHGALGEDGCLQGLLEVFGIPYVGADVRASAIASHKPTAKVLFRALGLPVAREHVVERAAMADERRLRGQAEVVLAELGTQLIVKPASGGSALGVERLFEASPESLTQALRAVLAHDAALVEQFHIGLEVTCGVLENPDAAALPPTLIHSQASDWYDFQSRYKLGGSRHECPAPLPQEQRLRIQQLAVSAHHAVGARDLSRVDFVVSSEAITVLEVNTLPGMTSTSLFPEAVAASGIPFADLCDLLVRRAYERPPSVRAAAPAIPV